MREETTTGGAIIQPLNTELKNKMTDTMKPSKFDSSIDTVSTLISMATVPVCGLTARPGLICVPLIRNKKEKKSE